MLYSLRAKVIYTSHFIFLYYLDYRIDKIDDTLSNSYVFV